MPAFIFRSGFYQLYYLCDFVVRDTKIALHLESPQKINFNLVSEIFQITGFNYW